MAIVTAVAAGFLFIMSIEVDIGRWVRTDGDSFCQALGSERREGVGKEPTN